MLCLVCLGCQRLVSVFGLLKVGVFGLIKASVFSLCVCFAKTLSLQLVWLVS